jgi:Ca2+-binding RTX toxin-like protein
MVFSYYFPTVMGGAGDDTIIVGRTDEWSYKTGFVDGGDGNDLIYGGGSGGAGNDRIDARGYAAAKLVGDAGAETLWGGDGNDTISSDRPVGFDGNTDVDTINAGAGNDMIFAGYGDISMGAPGSIR